jgi:DNA-binding transcriptional LysR family regulator
VTADTSSLLSALSLDQLRVFVCVADEGSFSAAARRLRRAQSAVSYAVANLERLLDVTLFDRGGQRPQLTPAGRALLDEAREVAARVDRLHARARSLAEGVEPIVSLVVDQMFPLDPLMAALAAFRLQYPRTAMHLQVEPLAVVGQLVASGRCQIGIAGPHGHPDGLAMRPLLHVRLVPVTAASHPLAAEPRPVPLAALRQHIQLVLTDRDERTADEQHGVVSPHTWRLADLRTKHALLRGGFGWGNMPVHMVEADLAAGALVALEAEHGLDRQVIEVGLPLGFVFREADPPGPAARWLMAELERRLQAPTSLPR